MLEKVSETQLWFLVVVMGLQQQRLAVGEGEREEKRGNGEESWGPHVLTPTMCIID